MKGKGKARSQGRRGRTDCRRTRKPEIPNMDISPVINVSREKRGNHTEPVHRRHLVSAEQLGVDHHRPDFYRPQSPQNPLKGGDELIRRRREKQPLEYPSAGSVFKRPEGYFAGALIEQCGLKGVSVGGAQVSEKHAGFIVNKGGATCADVCALVEKIQQTVLRETGVLLECEIRRLG